MANRTIKIVYKGKADKVLDEHIRKTLESAGFSFYASGMNLLIEERDISFDCPVLTDNVESA